MSEEDDRMDRARRIREMRERGRREPDADSDESTDEQGEAGESDDTESVNEAEASDEPAETTESGATADADETTAPDETGVPNETEVSESGSETVETEEADMSADESATTDDPEEDSTADEGAVVPEATEEEGISAPLPETDQLEEALEEEDATSEAETVAPGIEDEDEDEGEETRVLEFTLDDEHYCLDIEYVEEIVKQEVITRVPNTPAFVEGVVDLRGQITTILNPKVTLEKENDEPGELIIVFDAESFDDQGNIGWVVDDVRQVSLITDADVNDPPIEQEYINGVIDREDEEFVIWTTPDLALEAAE